MAYRATCVSQDPLDYFLNNKDKSSSLRVSDIVLRENKSPKEVFAHMIRLATNSKWSHSALLYLISDPDKGYNNTFLVEALTKGVHITSWRNEVVPYKQFTVGIETGSVFSHQTSPIMLKSCLISILTSVLYTAILSYRAF